MHTSAACQVPWTVRRGQRTSVGVHSSLNSCKLLGDRFDSVALGWRWVCRKLFEDGYDLATNRRVYDSRDGRTCHQCRQKTLGKRTQCSRCHSTTVRRCRRACSALPHFTAYIHTLSVETRSRPRKPHLCISFIGATRRCDKNIKRSEMMGRPWPEAVCCKGVAWAKFPLTWHSGIGAVACKCCISSVQHM